MFDTCVLQNLPAFDSSKLFGVDFSSEVLNVTKSSLDYFDALADTV